MGRANGVLRILGNIVSSPAGPTMTIERSGPALHGDERAMSMVGSTITAAGIGLLILLRALVTQGRATHLPVVAATRAGCT